MTVDRHRARRWSTTASRLPDANLLLGVAWHPSGEFALATLNRTKNLVPMTRILQGWTITNGLAVLWTDGRVDQVLLDEPDMRYFADVTDVAFTPDGRYALVTSAGHRPRRGGRRREAARAAASARPTRTARDVLPNQLGASDRVRRRRTSRSRDNPRGIAVAPDGSDGLGRQHARRLAHRDRPRDASQAVGAHRPRRAEDDHARPLRRAALPQREDHLPAPVRLRTPATRTATSTASPTTSRPTASA